MDAIKLEGSGGDSPTGAAMIETKALLARKTDELLQEREWLHVTLSSIGDAVIVTDKLGKITFLNPVAEVMTGWPKVDAVGQMLETVFHIIHEQTREAAPNPIRKVLAEGVVVGLANHTALLSKSGKETAIENSAAPIRDSFGAVSGAVMVFHDVTERRKMENALRTSHDQFFALVNHSPLRIFLLDEDLRFVQINRKALMAFDGRENLIGSKLSDLMETRWPPTIAAEIMANFRHTLETGEPFHQTGFAESRIDREQREYYDWEIHRITLSNEKKGVACYFIDISSHVQAQEELRKSENRKSAILSASLDAIITMDHFGKVIDFNPAAEKIFGYSQQEAVAKPLSELIIPERFRKRHYEGLARYLTTGEGPVMDKRLELPALRSNGEEFLVELSISRIPFSDPPMFTATLRDITERKASERALTERAQLSALRAEVSHALTTADDFKKVLQLCAEALVNNLDGAFARIWTIDETDRVLVMQASAGQYTHLDGPHGRVNVGEFKIGRIAQTGKPLFTNDVLHDKNISDPEWAKREGMVAFAGCPLLLEGKVTGVMAMFAKHPLSENVVKELIPLAEGIAQWVRRKRIEQELSQAQKKLHEYTVHLEATVQERTAELREKIGELEAFSYSVSHDMRSPLRAMQGYATALLEDHRGNLDQEAQNYLERIHRASTRLDLLIQEVLTYSQLAKQELKLQPVNLERLIVDIVETYPQFSDAHVVVTVEKPLRSVLGHEAFLTQIISNLLGNAVKFVRPGEQPKIRIRAEHLDPFVRVWVEDQGIGIDPMHFKRIFEIFGRVYAEKKYEGTGIGLAIVKKAVERMGGTIGVESTPDAGSRFWFTLKKA